MSDRLELLKSSLAKKQAVLSDKFSAHFATVKQANGQPLNDKRNGSATLAKWERQNDSIRRQQDEIEKTQRAIEVEEGKIIDVAHARESLPAEIVALIDAGELVQWRKHPNYFFVPGVDKARIIWYGKKKVVAHKFAREITDSEQRKKFAALYNKLYAVFNTPTPPTTQPTQQTQ